MPEPTPPKPTLIERIQKLIPTAILGIVSWALMAVLQIREDQLIMKYELRVAIAKIETIELRTTAIEHAREMERQRKALDSVAKRVDAILPKSLKVERE